MEGLVGPGKLSRSCAKSLGAELLKRQLYAVCLAAYPGPVGEAAELLQRLWCGLEVDRIFRVDSLSLGGKLLRWGWRLVSGGGVLAPEVRGLTDTRLLRQYLEAALEVEANGEVRGIARNLEEGRQQALAAPPGS